MKPTSDAQLCRKAEKISDHRRRRVQTFLAARGTRQGQVGHLTKSRRCLLPLIIAWRGHVGPTYPSRANDNPRCAPQWQTDWTVAPTAVSSVISRNFRGLFRFRVTPPPAKITLRTRFLRFFVTHTHPQRRRLSLSRHFLSLKLKNLDQFRARKEKKRKGKRKAIEQIETREYSNREAAKSGVLLFELN